MSFHTQHRTTFSSVTPNDVSHLAASFYSAPDHPHLRRVPHPLADDPRSLRTRVTFTTGLAVLGIIRTEHQAYHTFHPLDSIADPSSPHYVPPRLHLWASLLHPQLLDSFAAPPPPPPVHYYTGYYHDHPTRGREFVFNGRPCSDPPHHRDTTDGLDYEDTLSLGSTEAP